MPEANRKEIRDILNKIKLLIGEENQALVEKVFEYIIYLELSDELNCKYRKITAEELHECKSIINRTKDFAKVCSSTNENLDTIVNMLGEKV